MTIDLSPAEYGKLIGHSEEYVRRWCLPYGIRDDADAIVRLRVVTSDVMDAVYKREAVKK